METETRYKSVSEFNASNFNKRHVYLLNHVNQTPSVENVHFPPTVTMRCIDNVYDQEKKATRTLRVIKGELSIYADEQNKERTYREIEVITFVKGELVVEERQSQLFKFMELTNYNTTNPQRDKTKKGIFMKLDLEKGIQSEIDNRKKKFSAQTFCWDGAWEDVKSYARVLNIPVEDRDPAEVRWALLLVSEKDPEKFMKGLNNPATKRKHYILEALKHNILEKDTTQNSINWKNGGPICVAPPGMDATDCLVDETFKNQSGDRIMELIKHQLTSKNVIAEKTEYGIKESNIPKVDNKAVNKTEALKNAVDEIQLTTEKQLIKNLFAKGVIERKGPVWIMWDDEKGKAQGEAALEKMLKNDADLRTYLEKKLLELV